MAEGNSQPPPAQPPARPPKESNKPPGLEIIDRRRPERIVVPFYVVERFGGDLGMNGLALYLGLCYHVGRQKTVWPSYATLARELGTSRSTIERTMPILRDLKLVQVEPRIDRNGQKSNRITLIDPWTDERSQDEPSPQLGEAPSDCRRRRPQLDGAGAVNLTPPPVNLTAPTLEGSSRKSDKREEDPPPSASASEDEERAQVLRELWLRDLVCDHPGQRAAHAREIVIHSIELLRRGFTLDLLRAAVLDPERDRTEWPRLWSARIAAPVPREKDYATITAQNRADRAKGEEDAKALREKLGGRLSMTEAMERFRRGERLGATLGAGVGKMPDEKDP